MAYPENDRWPLAPTKTAIADLPEQSQSVTKLSLRVSRPVQLILVVFAAMAIAAIVSHFAVGWLGLRSSTMTYRRIGPTNGPQVFCAGSSVAQFGLSWPEISARLGQGIENWGLGGSTPEVWEVSQSLATNSNLMIIGISIYDLNEYHLCDARADVVPLLQTIQDLLHSHAEWQFSKRLLSQYPLEYSRWLFPTAGRSDAVLVGLRRKLAEHSKLFSSEEERANSLVLPRQGDLNFGESDEKLSDWPQAKMLRRLALLRTEIQGRHWFGGPKKLAFLRMLHRAQTQGRIIAVVMPVAPTYTSAFVTPQVSGDFEAMLLEAKSAAPVACWVRLDQLPALNSDEYYSDFVHLNAPGRRIATEGFLRRLEKYRQVR